jgi:hypothetical protein
LQLSGQPIALILAADTAIALTPAIARCTPLEI